MKPKRETISKQLIGAAGVFHVASELSRAGWVALPSIKNVKGADILVANPEGTDFAFFQVKTSLSKVPFWPISEGARKWKEHNCYYAFVRRVGDRFKVFLEKATVVARESEANDLAAAKRGNKKWAPWWALTGQDATEDAEERTRCQWEAFMLGPKKVE